MNIIIKDRIYFYSYKSIQNEFKTALTMQNPKWEEARRMGRNCNIIEKYVSMYCQHDDNLFSIPRGYEFKAYEILDRFFPNAKIDDQTTLNKKIIYKCSIALHKYQEPAAEAGLKTECNVLSLPTGGGKTVVALYMVFMRQQKTFILVHTVDLMYQWQKRIKEFLNYDCGLAGDGKFKIKDITVGIVKTVSNRAKKSKFADDFGYVIVDECHRTPSSTFVNALGAFKSYYMTGLTATPKRRDGLTDFIFWSIGDLSYKMKKSALVHEGKILKPQIIKTETRLLFGENPENDHISDHYPTLLKELKNSGERNSIIAGDIWDAAAENYACCLVLSDHEDHLQMINTNLAGKGIILTGKVPGKQRKQIIEDILANKVNILLATASLIGEGFDAPVFTHMFLTMPVGFAERLEQLVGRLVRTGNGKKVVKIFDYVDQNEVFHRQFKKRLKVYNSY